MIFVHAPCANPRRFPKVTDCTRNRIGRSSTKTFNTNIYIYRCTSAWLLLRNYSAFLTARIFNLSPLRTRPTAGAFRTNAEVFRSFFFRPGSNIRHVYFFYASVNPYIFFNDVCPRVASTLFTGRFQSGTARFFLLTKKKNKYARK